jgi:hypothetical protein
VADWFCQSCLEDEGKSPVRRNKRPVLKAKDLFEALARRNAEFDQRLAAVEAESEAFEAAKAYWRAVAVGVERLPEVRKDRKGNLLCGVPGCKCREKANRAEFFAVVKTNGKFSVVGLCLAQFAALKKSGVGEKIPASKFFNECRREAERRNASDDRFEAAKAYWLSVAAGTAEKMPEVRKDQKGNLLCGVPACGCRSEKPVEHFTVFGEQIVGVCRFSFAALKRTGVSLFAAGGPEGLERCQRHLEKVAWERARAARQAGGNGEKKPRFGQPGTGLRKKTRPNRAAREAAQRARQMARLEEQERLRREAEKNGTRYVFSKDEGHGKGGKGNKKSK